ncbi:MAG: hypothetical protein AAGK66_07325 [Pseudomonadota bacterium]
MKQSGLFGLAHLCQCVFDMHGLVIDETDDADEFEQRMTAIGKVRRQRPFDTTKHIIPRHRSMAILLKDGHRDITGVIARSLDIGDQPLSALLHEEARVLYGHDRVRSAVCPAAHQIRGRVAYFGEMFAPPADRGKPGVAAALVRYIQCLAFSKWSLDWSYAFIKKSEVEGRGRVAQYGFCIVEPNAQNWDGVEDQRRDSAEYMVANSRDQFDHLVKAAMQNPIDFLPGYERVYSNAKQIATGVLSEPPSEAFKRSDQ